MSRGRASRPHRPSTCPSGKVRFRDRIAANLALATIQRRDRPGREKLEVRVYRCSDCRGFHLTSQRSRAAR
ncbi:hypothetical protein J4573_29665 [Actinomadura barringtoniae]|uniref:Uncharacterized protein n=1 Tax=Actinomadura barringtoniae TaxID=1427535 RepID=A0A939PLD9_9ACTN|nr:hypothetical protein [Actinomadura barringtoniae]MBO2451294.1 hypothetical protein [Actinomadura barringtoniae]